MFEESESLKLPVHQCFPHERRPPHPDPLPQFFARRLRYDTTLHPQKNRGRGGNMALSKQKRVQDYCPEPSACVEFHEIALSKSCRDYFAAGVVLDAAAAGGFAPPRALGLFTMTIAIPDAARTSPR
jgi:hypothetical protein